MERTANVSIQSFDAIAKQFTYLRVNGFNEIEKMEVKQKQAM